MINPDRRSLTGIAVAKRLTESRSGVENSMSEGLDSKQAHREWHSRGYLPHFDHGGTVQGLTSRLADSLPKTVRDGLEIEKGTQRRVATEEAINAGAGECWLKQPGIAAIMEGALLHFDTIRYRLLAWVVMPNHVHVVIEQAEGWSLSDIVKSWKTFVAREANKLLGREGPFWAKDYFDRYVRDAAQLQITIDYVHRNPVKAGLVSDAEDWRWSSAYLERSKLATSQTHADGGY